MMQVINTKPSAYTIAGKHVIPPNGIATFDDDLWAELKKRKSVQHWLANGHLKEVSGDAPAPEASSEPATDAAPKRTARRGSGTGGAAG